MLIKWWLLTSSIVRFQIGAYVNKQVSILRSPKLSVEELLSLCPIYLPSISSPEEFHTRDCTYVSRANSNETYGRCWSLEPGVTNPRPNLGSKFSDFPIFWVFFPSFCHKMLQFLAICSNATNRPWGWVATSGLNNAMLFYQVLKIYFQVPLSFVLCELLYISTKIIAFLHLFLDFKTVDSRLPTRPKYLYFYFFRKTLNCL
jgi:hypothetical protein